MTEPTPDTLRAAYIAALDEAHHTHPCPATGRPYWLGCVHYDDAGRMEGVGSCHSGRRADAVLAVRDEEMTRLRAELNRLRDELAEEKALHNPRLRGLLVKAAKDQDLYVQWSTVCDMPGGVFSRETALEYGFPRSTVDHADAHGSSSHHGDGAWDDKGWVAEQRGWLPRHLIGEYAVEYLHGDRQAAYRLLEPFEDEAEVRQ